MGSCVCKCTSDDDFDPMRCQWIETNSVDSVIQSLVHAGGNKFLSELVDKLVNETLDIIAKIGGNDPDTPNSIFTLHMITDKAAGWLELIYSLMRVVPLEHPMGPSVITLLLDDSPLPTKDTVMQVVDIVPTLLKYEQQLDQRKSQAKHDAKLQYLVRVKRNFFIILGCLAEKLAGPNSISLLNDVSLDYLMQNFVSNDTDPNLKLLSLIAIEKFAQTSENKTTIKKRLAAFEKNPLRSLEERYVNHKDFTYRQIGFCARWCLDNYFPIAERKYSYETEDVSAINAMLNARDASEYLKISPNGLEARSDAYSFESVRCTFQVREGCWYYEVLLITPGVMQIGWATKNASFLNDDGYGIGDDNHSISYDGCRQLVWHNAKSYRHTLPQWKSGSILGCLLDISAKEVIFSLDGEETFPHCNLFHDGHKEGEGFFAAASFMSFQQCYFNFGIEPFRYPPTKRKFKSFNECSHLESRDKVILPRHLYLEILKQVNVNDDCCTLCFDRKGVVKLEPCQHRGFCEICVSQLQICPLCRSEIINNLEVKTILPDTENTEDVKNVQNTSATANTSETEPSDSAAAHCRSNTDDEDD